MIRDLHRVVELLEEKWHGKRVLVVGDVMLDRYIWGEVNRISPEAPVPVVRSVDIDERPGAAANVAMNIVGLGASATLLALCGDDSDGVRLTQAVMQMRVEAHLIPIKGHPTTTKTRIICGKQQMLRIDAEKTDDYPAEAYSQLLAQLEKALDSVDAVILSDYAKGVLTEDVCQSIITAARNRGLPILVDPKRRELDRYRGATTICPNLSELASTTGLKGVSVNQLLDAGAALVDQLQIDYLTATLSEKGIAVVKADSKFIAPAQARQVFDVSGAGDTVIATLALALGSGVDIESAVQLANVAAGIVVGKIGTVPVTRDELLRELTSEIGLKAEEKVVSLGHLLERVSAWRSGGQSRIAFTNGCFDLLHIGHITLLENARKQADRLIVGINSDSSVSGLKGPTRPIVSQRERARVLAALAAVDLVIVFDEPTPLRLIEAIRPDVIIKGGDYSEETVVGAKEVRAWGGLVKIIPIVEGFSTSNIIAKLGNAEGEGNRAQ